MIPRHLLINIPTFYCRIFGYKKESTSIVMITLKGASLSSSFIQLKTL